jgi:hypothetical protein
LLRKLPLESANWYCTLSVIIVLRNNMYTWERVSLTNLPCLQWLVFNFSIATSKKTLHKKIKLEARMIFIRVQIYHIKPRVHVNFINATEQYQVIILVSFDPVSVPQIKA